MHGYGRTSIRVVATRASVDPALVHRFYPTKTGLFTAAVLEPHAAAILGQLTDAYLSGLTQTTDRNNPDLGPALFGALLIGVTIHRYVLNTGPWHTRTQPNWPTPPAPRRTISWTIAFPAGVCPGRLREPPTTRRSIEEAST